MKSFTAPIAVANLPKADEKLHTFGQGMLTKFSNNPKLNNAPVTMAAFGTHLATYAAAIAAAPHGGPSALADRASARKVVVDDIKMLKAYAQSVANQQTSAEDAAGVIIGGGLLIKKVGKRVKPELAAKNGVPGTVLLAALALKKRGMWYFEYSTDQKTWVLGVEALKASGTVTGLTPMTMYYFRCRTRTSKQGLGDYSQIVSLWVM